MPEVPDTGSLHGGVRAFLRHCWRHGRRPHGRGLREIGPHHGCLSPALRDHGYSFCDLAGEANVLVFPSLEAANVAYKLLQHLGGAVAIGPILAGMAKPVHVLSRGADVTGIANIAAITVIDAQDTTLWDAKSRPSLVTCGYR